MYIQILFFCIINIPLIIYLIRYYDLKELIFWILAKKNGNTKIVYFKNLNEKSIQTINKILQLKTKGMFIEHLIATPAWKPIISLESVDNDEWKIVKQNFIYFISQLNMDINLIEQYIQNYLEEYIIINKIIDSKIISQITVKTFCKFLFQKELNINEIEILFLGSIEWRKEIALKDKGDINIKNSTIQIIIDLIKSNEKIYKIFGENWEKPEFYSVIAQPFIISPMINVSDIMSNAQTLLSKSLLNSNDDISNETINKIIYSYHPFPILERYDSLTNTQYFIPLESLTNFNNYNEENKILVFGMGVRKCPGQTYAYIVLKKMISMYFMNIDKFNPSLNHKFSGRNNDIFVLSETIYMAKMLIKIIFY